MKLSQMNRRQKINLATYLAGICVLLFLCFFFISTGWIGYSVKDNCNKAQLQFEGNCVQALIQIVEADFETNISKNSAIWTLGQLGDSEGLPLLESKYTGEVADEGESWENGISQYELKKAINLLKGGWNITAAFWR